MMSQAREEKRGEANGEKEELQGSEATVTLLQVDS